MAISFSRVAAKGKKHWQITFGFTATSSLASIIYLITILDKQIDYLIAFILALSILHRFIIILVIIVIILSLILYNSLDLRNTVYLKLRFVVNIVGVIVITCCVLLLIVNGSKSIFTNKRYSPINIQVISQTPMSIELQEICNQIQSIIKSTNSKSDLSMRTANRYDLASLINDAKDKNADLVIIDHPNFSNYLANGSIKIDPNVGPMFLSLQSITPRILRKSSNLISLGSSIVYDTFNIAKRIALFDDTNVLIVTDDTDLSQFARRLLIDLLDSYYNINHTSINLERQNDIDSYLSKNDMDVVVELLWKDNNILPSSLKKYTNISPSSFNYCRKAVLDNSIINFLDSFDYPTITSVIANPNMNIAYPTILALAHSPISYNPTKSIDLVMKQLGRYNINFNQFGQIHYFYTTERD